MLFNFFKNRKIKKQEKQRDELQKSESERVKNMMEKYGITENSIIEICFKDKSKPNIIAIYLNLSLYSRNFKYGLAIINITHLFDSPAKGTSSEDIYCEDIDTLTKRNDFAEKLKKIEANKLEQLSAMRSPSGMYIRFRELNKDIESFDTLPKNKSIVIMN